MPLKQFGVAVVGGGAAGLGPLLCAVRRGRFDELMQRGVAIIEKETHLGGSLGEYIVNSDTHTGVFLEFVPDHPLVSAKTRRIAEDLRATPGTNIELRTAGVLLRELGNDLKNAVDSAPRCGVYTDRVAQSIRVRRDGGFEVLTHPTGDEGRKDERRFRAQDVVLALGGKQRLDDSVHATICGRRRPLLHFRHKLILSDDLLQGRDLDRARRLVRQSEGKPILILGGSHSAFSAAWTLLNKVQDYAFGAGQILIASRRVPKVFFPSAEEARKAGYADFGPSDICARTGRVYRFAGLRADGRELYMRLVGLAAPLEERVQVLHLAEIAGDLLGHMSEACLIISALGYRPRVPSVFDADGQPIRLASDVRRPLVDARCRVLRADGTPIPNCFAIGLASGFVPRGALGGEPSFRGQTNGLWYYHNDVGDLILRQLLQSEGEPT